MLEIGRLAKWYVVPDHKRCKRELPLSWHTQTWAPYRLHTSIGGAGASRILGHESECAKIG